MLTDIQVEKQAIRDQIRNKKKAYPLQSLKNQSSLVMKKLEALPLFRNANNILMYWSMPKEVYTQDTIQKFASNKQIFLPQIVGDTIEIRLFEGKDNMVKSSYYNVWESVGPSLKSTDELDLIILPGLAFDADKNRLGRGKAYYDRLLTNKNCTTIGIAFDFQIVPRIPMEKHDMPLDMVISPQKVYK
jgi:5-formyltetrahydrofolate cyclo-ligase